MVERSRPSVTGERSELLEIHKERGTATHTVVDGYNREYLLSPCPKGDVNLCTLSFLHLAGLVNKELQRE